MAGYVGTCDSYGSRAQDDMSIFDAKYKDDGTGCRAYDPKIILKPVLLGWARSLLTARKVETPS